MGDRQSGQFGQPVTVPPSAPPAAKPLRAAPPKAARPAAKPAKAAAAKGGFFGGEPVLIDIVPDEKAEQRQYKRLLKRIFIQTVVIAVLAGFVVITMPLYRPIYQYAGRDPAGHTVPLSALDMPNMTNRAVLSWATTSVTGILTIGFGDFDKKLLAQKTRFTPDGWDSFVGAFFNQKIGQTFQQNQLVLTTVPSGAAVIVAQGLNKDDIYQWKVEVPVVMTYATNNNVTRHDHAVITLMIVRVWPEQSPSGIAIKSWS